MLFNICKKIILAIDAAVRQIALWLIVCYQYTLSPWLGASCRFSPTCSQYAKAVFTSYSAPQALWLTIKRLARCHPFCEGGEDLPPVRKSLNTLQQQKQAQPIRDTDDESNY